MVHLSNLGFIGIGQNERSQTLAFQVGELLNGATFHPVSPSLVVHTYMYVAGTVCMTNQICSNGSGGSGGGGGEGGPPQLWNLKELLIAIADQLLQYNSVLFNMLMHASSTPPPPPPLHKRSTSAPEQHHVVLDLIGQSRLTLPTLHRTYTFDPCAHTALQAQKQQ